MSLRTIHEEESLGDPLKPQPNATKEIDNEREINQKSKTKKCFAEKRSASPTDNRGHSYRQFLRRPIKGWWHQLRVIKGTRPGRTRAGRSRGNPSDFSEPVPAERLKNLPLGKIQNAR